MHAPTRAGAQALGGRAWAGLLLGVAAATSFAANSTLARLAYDAGSNALSVLTVRTGVALLGLLVLLKLARVPFRLPPRRRAAALGLGVLLAVYSYGLLGAIEHIPVALAVITFYTYPLLTACGSWALGREPVTPRTFAALLAAFVGLVLALDIRGGGVDARGVAMALMAAFVFATILLSSDRVRAGGDSRPITLHMLAAGFATYLLACALTGGFALPAPGIGWAGFIGTPLFYSFSIISLFVVVMMTGPVRAALTLNVEPVASVILGYVVLGQALAGTQLFGIAVVIAAVVSIRASGYRRWGAAAARDLVPVAMIVVGGLLLAGALALHWTR